jgi:uncharacterized cupin superfamily protein
MTTSHPEPEPSVPAYEPMPRVATPNVPVRASEHPLDAFRAGARFASEDLPLGRLGGAKHIGVNLTAIPPGAQSCPFHWHLKEEEHFYVLEGRCVLRSGEGRHEMQAGDYVCFPAGTRVAHCFENPFDAPCKMLAIGPDLPDEICGYPDSDKLRIRALGMSFPIPTAAVDYWHGERVSEPLDRAPAGSKSSPSR